jgi:hypothetical protein
MLDTNRLQENALKHFSILAYNGSNAIHTTIFICYIFSVTKMNEKCECRHCLSVHVSKKMFCDWRLLSIVFHIGSLQSHILRVPKPERWFSYFIVPTNFLLIMRDAWYWYPTAYNTSYYFLVIVVQKQVMTYKASNPNLVAIGIEIFGPAAHRLVESCRKRIRTQCLHLWFQVTTSQAFPFGALLQ